MPLRNDLHGPFHKSTEQGRGELKVLLYLLCKSVEVVVVVVIRDTVVLLVVETATAVVDVIDKVVVLEVIDADIFMGTRVDIIDTLTDVDVVRDVALTVVVAVGRIFFGLLCIPLDLLEYSFPNGMFGILSTLSRALRAAELPLATAKPSTFSSEGLFIDRARALSLSFSAVQTCACIHAHTSIHKAIIHIPNFLPAVIVVQHASIPKSAGKASSGWCVYVQVCICVFGQGCMYFSKAIQPSKKIF